MKFNMLGNANYAGPVRLSDTYDKAVGGAQTGIAASQKALYNAYNSLNSSITTTNIRTAHIDSSTVSREIIFIKNIHYDSLPSKSTETQTYLKEFCVKLLSEYPNRGYCIFIGSAHPNSTGAVIIHYYGTKSDNIVSGVPRYCSGVYFSLGASFCLFGYMNATWYYKQY